jgi:hypothetical protein
MNTLTTASIAGTVLAAGLMVAGLASPANADPSAPPSAPGSSPPASDEPCSALRQAIDMSNDLARPVIMRAPYVVRVPVTDPPTRTILVGTGALGGATLAGAGLAVWSHRRRGPAQELFDEGPRDDPSWRNR